MKRFLAILLTVFLLVLTTPTLAENSEWEFDESQCTLTKYTGAGGDVVVPEKIGSAAVKTLDTGALAQVSGMTSLTLPEGVLHLKDNVGWWNSELVRLSLPQSLIIIGSNSFNDCDALESVTIPAGVRYIGNGAFSDSELLKSVTFEGICPTFDGEAFTYLAEDVVAYVPDDQLEAYQAAFSAMENEITVQPSGKNAMIVDNDGFHEEDFEFDAATGTIVKYSGDAVYMSIPEAIGGVQVKAVGENAFQFNRNLAFVTLPEGLEAIENSAFANCFTLLHVDFPATLQTIGESAFSGSYLGYTLDIPSVQTIDARAFEHAWLRGELTLPEGLTSIGESAFANCTSLRELYLPATLKSIGSAAFYQNWSLNYIYMDGVTLPEVATDAFAECSALEDIDLNEHCTKQQMLDMQALVDGMGLSCAVWRAENSKVDHFNDDLDTYADGFLTSYTGTETRVRPWGSCNSVQTIGISDGVFKGSQTLEIFAVPHSDNFTTIGAEAFMDSTLKEVDLFDSVTTIGARAFANCAQLEELTIPESVTSIGEGAFDGLTGLKKLTILCDPALIPEGSFLINGEPIDAEIRLSASATDEQLARTNEALNRPWYDPVARVGEASAFVKMPFEATDAANFEFDPATGTVTAYTGSDVDVVIPREIVGVTVTAIDHNAFEACRDYTNTETTSDRTEWVHLRSVVIPETVRSIGDDLFSYCQQLETVVCYAPLETTGGTAFIPSPGGKQVWQPGTIMSILSNEKYKGDALLQKTFCTDFLTKKMKVNEGEVPQYYVENSHPAIVSDEMFDEVQQEIARRKQSGRQHNGTSSFAGKIFCDCCGEMYGSKVWHSNDKYRRVIWQCNAKFKDGKRCETPHLTESIIQQKFLAAMNQLLEQRDFIIEDMTAIMQQLTDTTALENEAAELHAEMDITSQLVRQLIEQNASMALNQSEYEQRYQSLSERFNKAAERMKIIEAECVRRKSQRDTMERFLNTLMASENVITDFSTEMWNALLEKMIVQENGSVKVVFKNGMEITV